MIANKDFMVCHKKKEIQSKIISMLPIKWGNSKGIIYNLVIRLLYGEP